VEDLEEGDAGVPVLQYIKIKYKYIKKVGSIHGSTSDYLFI